MPKRAAQGSGSIRKKEITRNGKKYVYWEARVTTGRDPGTGKQIQKSITGKTQREVLEKLSQLQPDILAGTYKEPSRLYLHEWLDIWLETYFKQRAKPSTFKMIDHIVQRYIKPFFPACKLADFRPASVQAFINSMDGLAPSTIKSRILPLNLAMKQAVLLNLVEENPVEKCTKPKASTESIEPFTDNELNALFAAASGSGYENILKIAVLTGMRIGEILGLTWDRINTRERTITIDRQWIYTLNDFSTPKNRKTRVIYPAALAFEVLDAQKLYQMKQKLKAGAIWDNEPGFVFTTNVGRNIYYPTLSLNFNKFLSAAGIAQHRFHDLRHTYAVNAIRAGDDIKTISGNLGHSSVAFTLDRYAHFTDDLKRLSAERIDTFARQHYTFI